MKKRITKQQLLTVSEQGLVKLMDWSQRCGQDSDLQNCILWSRRGMVVPLLNIGDMLEFLEACGITPTQIPGPASQWCDILWSIVTSQLEREEHS